MRRVTIQMWGLVSWSLSVLYSVLLSTPAVLAAGCDQTIYSTKDGIKMGEFTSPNWPNSYDNNMRCIFRFIGLPGEKVQIKFNTFEVKGVHQRCQDDYVDVYTRVQDPDVNLLDVPLHGRYCGSNLDNLPHLLISMYNVLILGFYTDGEDVEKGFQGDYDFIDASIYMIGTPASPTVCGQMIYGDHLPTGMLYSPTYPGMYPDNIFCYYKLIGKPGQRIRFTLNDLDMYSGGEHCPYDYIKIYDGYTNEAEVIGTYCGKLKDLQGIYMPPDIYSTAEAMLIEFVTRSGRVEPTKKAYVPYWEVQEDTQVKQRGFNASFEFSDKFVKLDFIRQGEHVRGTECDQRVCSKGETNGSIITPNYPDHYPPNILCKYYIDGLVDKQNLEKTKLTFHTFDIPSEGDGCESAFVKAYVKGQDIQKKADEYDFDMCGEMVPTPLVTSNPRLLLVFQAGSQTGNGFSASYQFVTDYAIPGTPATGIGCHFNYMSSSAKVGTFNSPRNPSHYPPSTQCIYEFHGLPGEQVLINFENFELQHDDTCSKDWVEMYMVRELKHKREENILVGHYCGGNIPGPMVTDMDYNKARVIFHSDASDVGAGFRAKYEFLRSRAYGKEVEHTYRGLAGSEITSPNFPIKYPQNSTRVYNIYASNPSNKILLEFVTFKMEGRFDVETRVYKCPSAVLKIYTNHTAKPQYELCAEASVTHIISQQDFMKIKFISTSSSTSNLGFKLSWTELFPIIGDKCEGFHCVKNNFCISSTLRCNHRRNCGDNDKSDETANCDSSYTDHGVLHIILGVVISLIVLVFIIVCILHRRRKARKKKNKKEIEVRYVTRGSTTNHRLERDGPVRDKLLKEHTEKVSIV